MKAYSDDPAIQQIYELSYQRTAAEERLKRIRRYAERMQTEDGERIRQFLKDIVEDRI